MEKPALELVRNFTGLGRNDADIAGGKGASLGEMTQAGIPVPPGFVVLSSSFEEFIHETGLVAEIDSILHRVDHKEIHTVEAASESIRALILNVEMPKDIADEIDRAFKLLDTKYVAVRSSATAEDGKDHAWAGQLESYLNTKEDDVLTKVKLCWSSLFTPRAIFYRFEKGLHSTKISVAVVVQKMVESEISGIAFSVHPVTEDRNQLIIEAGFGLGEAIVSGSVTPDSYVVEKEPRNILDINVSTQTRALYRSETASVEHGNNEWIEIAEPRASSQVLNEAQILELSQIILNIENHYGFPCDIEWAYEGGKFYIVQSRPITTLSGVPDNSASIKINSEEVVKHALIDSKLYQQLFSSNGMSFLLSDIFMSFYKNLGGLSIFAHKKWTSFLPLATIEDTSKQGLEMFSVQEKFDAFKIQINSYFTESARLFEDLLKNEKLTAELAKLYMNAMSEAYVHYSKTEFFYTDEPFKHAEDNDVIAKNLKEFEDIKNDNRVKMNKVFFQPDSYRKLFMALIGKQFNLTKDQVSSYGVEDVLNLFNGIYLTDEVVQNRDRAYLMNGTGNDIEYFEGEAAENIADVFYVQVARDSGDELKGIIAHTGKVKAPVTIISFGDNMFSRLQDVIKDMPEGNVLVADTTSPELFTACKKASAILTNQGGMMSHAAIISRELNIPCVVGLSNITERVKDGDMVEVDADNGIVRILK